jgi:hypothetical protein
MTLLRTLWNRLAPRVEDTDADMRRMRHFLLWLGIGSFIAFQVWRAVFTNFAVQEAGVSAPQMGMIQGLRELPGLLALGVILLLRVLPEQRLALAAAATMALGIAATGFLPSYGGILATTLVMSTGFHYFETTAQSLALQHMPKDRLPLFLGQLGSWTGLAGAAGLGLAFLLGTRLDEAGLMLAGGLLLAGMALFAAWRWPAIPPKVAQRTGMVFRRRYGLYYALTFLAGARRQIFVAFAVFLMVERFGFTAREITGLYLVNSVVVLLAAPRVGRLVRSMGERFVTLLEYSSLIVLFWGYTVVETRWLLALLFVADQLLYLFSMAIRTWFQKIADPADVAPSMAAGFTINHVAAVVIPPLGGLMWAYDYRLPFQLGMVLAVGSLLLALRMRPAETAPAAALPQEG